jgi:hypothetical protein
MDTATLDTQEQKSMPKDNIGFYQSPRYGIIFVYDEFYSDAWKCDKVRIAKQVYGPIKLKTHSVLRGESVFDTDRLSNLDGLSNLDECIKINNYQEDYWENNYRFVLEEEEGHLRDLLKAELVFENIVGKKKMDEYVGFFSSEYDIHFVFDRMEKGGKFKDFEYSYVVFSPIKTEPRYKYPICFCKDTLGREHNRLNINEVVSKFGRRIEEMFSEDIELTQNIIYMCKSVLSALSKVKQHGN